MPWLFGVAERHFYSIELIKTKGMSIEILIQKLEHIETLIKQQGLLQKDILNMNEACQYLRLKKSYMYKLTSSKSIPHFCPQGKNIYFKRTELDDWLLRNRKDSQDEIEQRAADYLINKGSINL